MEITLRPSGKTAQETPLADSTPEWVAFGADRTAADTAAALIALFLLSTLSPFITKTPETLAYLDLAVNISYSLI